MESDRLTGSCFHHGLKKSLYMYHLKCMFIHPLRISRTVFHLLCCIEHTRSFYIFNVIELRITVCIHTSLKTSFSFFMCEGGVKFDIHSTMLNSYCFGKGYWSLHIYYCVRNCRTNVLCSLFEEGVQLKGLVQQGT